MDMNGAVSKQSGSASQGANIIKTPTSGKGGEGGAERRGSRARSSLHLSPSVPIKSERRKEERKAGSFLDRAVSARAGLFAPHPPPLSPRVRLVSDMLWILHAPL